MIPVLRSTACERVRTQVSLELDGELSELERRMLAAHLDRCPDCRAFEADVTAFTKKLRVAPLEAFDQPIVIRRPRRVSLARAQAGVAAAIAVVALGAVSQLTEVGVGRSSPQAPAPFGTSADAAREVQQILADGRAFKHTGGNAIPI